MEKEKEKYITKQLVKKAREEMPPRDPYQGGYNPQPTKNPKIDVQA